MDSSVWPQDGRRQNWGSGFWCEWLIELPWDGRTGQKVKGRKAHMGVRWSICGHMMLLLLWAPYFTKSCQFRLLGNCSPASPAPNNLWVQFSPSVMSSSLWPHEPQHTTPPCPSPTPELMSIESVMPSNHLIICCPLLLLPSIFPSIRVFSNESALHIRWTKYWSFSFNTSPSNEHPGLISFRMDWFDLLAVQGTLKSLLQHHGSKGKVEVTLS